MPLEIRELVIKATVDGQSGGQGADGSGGGGNEEGQAELINICVEKVLEILKEKSER